MAASHPGLPWSSRLIALAYLLLALPAGVPAAASAAPQASAASQAPPTFTVNSAADVIASAPLNNGICQTAPVNHICTLRAAIMKANHWPGGGATIVLPPLAA